MQHHLEHQSPQFAVNSQFESFSALKHACTRAALLDVYEFVPDKDLDRYILKCKDRECIWYLYGCSLSFGSKSVFVLGEKKWKF